MRFLAIVVFAFLIVPSAHAGGLVDAFGPPAWQANGTQVDGLFGFSVSAAGDVDGDGYGDVIVGADLEDSTFTNEGAAYLYRGSKNGSLLAPSWVVHGRQADAALGIAVAPAGDVNNDGYGDVLVGVSGWDTPTTSNAGKVMVFHGGPNGLSTTPAITLFSPTPSVNEGFGLSVAYAGDVNGDGYADVLVGSGLKSGALTIGAAYLFEGSASGLSATPAMTMLGFPVGDSQFGASLSTAGDVNADGFADFIVGSPGDSRTFANAGAAYVFTGKAVGVPELDTLIVGTAANVGLGQSVSGAGDVNADGYGDVVIGVPRFGTNFPGKAVIGLGSPTGIATVTDIPNPEAPANEQVGTRVATVGDVNGDGIGDVAVVGRYASATQRGRVTLYLGSRTGLQYYGEILSRGTTGFFGVCVGSSGDTDGDGRTEILVGTEDASVTGTNHEGIAYQFKLPRPGLKLAAGGWPRVGSQPGTGYGSAVALVTRFDASDPGKLIVGDPQFGGKGRISVHGGAQITGVNFNEERSYTAATNFQSLGARIVDLGDVDGDSYSDYAVSGPTLDDGPTSQAGAVFLYRGGLGVPPPPSVVVTGATEFDKVGSALAGRGDVNGDGYEDLVVGAREWDEPGLPDCGKVWVFFGSPTGLLATPPWTGLGTAIDQGFGAGVALADYDADGYTDLIVGSTCTPGANLPGKVEVFFGGPSGPANTPGITYRPPVPEESFGLTVAAVGDVSGDGIADIAVGAPHENNNRGAVRVYTGSLGRSQYTYTLATFTGTQDNARLGEAIAGGGDVDGDGFGDMAIGEPGWDGGQTDEGRFALYYGPVTPNSVPGVVLESDLLGVALGASIAPFRDINNDGFADVVVGAPGVAGRVYPYMGGGTFGWRNEIDAFDYGGATQRTMHPGRSHDPNHLAAALYMTTGGQGRSKIGFQVEVKTLDRPFDGVPTNFTGPQAFSSGTAGSQSFLFTMSLLSPELPGRTLKVRGRCITPNPLFPRTRWITPEMQTSGDHDVWITGSGVGVPAPGASALRIESIAPNPAFGDGASRVAFTLPQAARVTLDLYDVRGARVRRLLDDTRPAGPSSVAWDGLDDHARAAPSGVYLMVLKSGTALARARLVRLP